MGTLIQDAAEVASCATAIDNAIVAKGGTLVGGGKLRNAAAGIATIQTGASVTPLSVTSNGTYTAPTGTGYSPITVNVTEYTPLPDAPDIRSIISNHEDSDSYIFRGIVLIDVGVSSWSATEGVLFCDTDATISGRTVTFTDTTKYNWVIIASNSLFGQFSSTRNQIVQLYGDANRSEGKYGIAFNNTVRLWPYNNSGVLESMTGSIDFSRVTNVQAMFDGCATIKKLPDVLDYRGANNGIGSSISGVSLGLEKMPDYVYLPDIPSNYTFPMSNKTNIDKTSFAKFDDNDNLTGGMVKNLNAVNVIYQGYTRTIALPTNLSGQFTSAQRTTIINRCNSLGYTLTNFTA